MAIETAQPQTTYDEWFDRRWRLTGLLLGMMVLVTAALLVTTGMRPATYGDLLADVASGKVDEVRVIGADAPTAGDRVEVRWTFLGGVLDQYAVVRVAGDHSYNAWAEPELVTSVDPRETLRGINSGINITSGSSRGDSSFSFMEWQAPGAVVLLAMVTWLAVLLLLIGGPQPWRATRWAWFWLGFPLGPLGVLAFLLLGGPLGLWRPRDLTRRLTGGWAFLIVFLVGGLGAS